MIVRTGAGLLGPFNNVEPLADRLKCDGTDLPFNVIGAYEILADDSLIPPKPAPAKTREQLKAERQYSVDAIKVTVSTGKVFDGNDEAQMNMLLALEVARIANLTETLWTLADNNRVLVTLSELKEAVVLSGLAKSEIWSAT